MRYPQNTFVQLCERVELNRWYHRCSCMPSAESELHNEINRIGVLRLLYDMGDLEGDFYDLPHWEDIAQSILEEAERITYKLENLNRLSNPSPIMEELAAIRAYENRMHEERIQRENALHAEIAKRKADRLAEKNRIHEHRNELKVSFQKTLDDFNTKDLEGKLEIIIHDCKRNPDAYPLDLLSVTQEEWQTINPETKHELKERLLVMKDRQYKELIEQL